MSIRFKITAGFIVVIVLANVTLALVTAKYVRGVVLGEVQTRVRLDLKSAHQVFAGQIDALAQVLHTAAARRPAASTLAEEVQGGLAGILQAVRLEGRMDMLTLVGLDGIVAYRAHSPGQAGDDLSGIEIVARALREGKPAHGAFRLPGALLERDGADLARRARIDVQDTPGARPLTRVVETDGLVVGVAVPYPSLPESASPRGVLFGGILLNGRFDLVDRIKDVVFQGQTHEGKEIGASTIFLDDVRIATTVRGPEGIRAVGSRMQKEVFDHLYGRKGDWADRAFVVNEWYITAYEPILDPAGTTIGALYVGLLEEPFTRPQKVIILFFMVSLSLTVLAIIASLVFVTQRILRPIPPIVAMCRKVMGGDLAARVGIRPPGEMGMLCRTIDAMADAMVQREELLHQRTREQIGQTEKLASIGRLAAGIAHEINNPLTGVLTFTHLLRQKPHLQDEDRSDLDVVIRETTRVREIVRGLLDFARQSKPAKEMLDINDVVKKTTTLLRSQKEFSKVKTEELLDATLPPVLGDRNQLQQVFLNLGLNACEAMPGGGILTIETSYEEGQVIITFADTGTGIKKEHLDKIFDPFFTTKPVGKGTGLGLSVSYGTVQSHGGTIEVKSEEGRGTVFTISLPLSAEARGGEPQGKASGHGAR